MELVRETLYNNGAAARPAAENTVKRLFAAESIKQDKFAIILNGEELATVDYDTARSIDEYIDTFKSSSFVDYDRARAVILGRVKTAQAVQDVQA